MNLDNIFAKDGFFWWIGVVEDREDPMKIGRCRVRIFGYHQPVIPKEDLPWAMPMQPITSAAIGGKGSSPVGPLEGTWVIGFFLDGANCQNPCMMGTIGGLPKAPPAGSIGQGNVTGEGVVTDGEGNTVKDAQGDPIIQGTAPPKDQKVSSNFEVFVATCKKFGLTDPKFLAAAVGNVYKECGFKSKSEDLKGYGVTPLPRIREIFGSRVSKYNDADLRALSQDTAKFSDAIYGYQTKLGRDMGNTEPGDGYKYRGRGFIQLTGKKNYREIGALIGEDLVNNPDKVNDPVIAAKTSAAYFKRAASGTYVNAITGVKFPGATQADANYWATSAVAGSNIKAFDYGLKILKIVEGYAASYVPGTPGGKEIAAIGEQVTPPPSQVAAKNQPNPETTKPTDKLNNPKLGQPKPYSDPNNAYPAADYENRKTGGDTNKLATGGKDAQDTPVLKTKSDKRLTNILAGNPDTWNEPESAYCAKYPYNHMIETESGHVIEMDDTPQRERLHVYHRAGTFFEIDQFGSMHEHIQGDYHGVFVRNNKVYIRGGYDVTVEKATRILAKDALQIISYGATKIDIRNDATVNVHGKADVSVTDDLKVRGKNLYMESENDIHIKAGGSLFMGANDVHLRGSGSLNLDGGTTDINSGTAGSPSGTGLSAPADRRSPPGDGRFDDLIRPGCDPDSEFKGNNDAGEAPPGAGVAAGVQTQEDVEASKAKQDAGCKRSDLNKPSIVAATPYKLGEFASFKETPYTIQLSKRFKLGDVAHVGSESAALNKEFWSNSSKTTHPGCGLTKSQILDNLRGLCVNVLDPIKERFPAMMMTSCLRFDVPAGGAAKSQHLTGCAVDMQFGSDLSQLYDVALWIRDNVAYDQLLLEYYTGKGKTTGWIHCSFNPNGNRPAGGAKVGTFMDHQVAKGKDGTPKWYLCDLS